MNKRTRGIVVLGLLIIIGAALGLYYKNIDTGTTSLSLSDATVAQSSNAAVADATLGTTVSAKTVLALPAGSAKLTTLPLGDKKYSTTGAKKGNIYLCNVATGGGGAQVNGSWIHGTTWTPGEKISVQGAVTWPKATYSMKVSGTTRVITANGLPVGVTTGIFPVAASDPAHAIDANPNSIGAQNYNFSLPAYPTFSATPNCMYGEVGIMNNGVILLDGFDAEYRDAPAHEVEDTCYGHPHDTTYHYHSLSPCIKNATISSVVGFAFDGFPITGNLLPTGKYVTSSDLDECHGMTSTITLDGKAVNSYHYVMTQDFPYSVGCFKAASHEPKPEKSGTMTGMNMGGSTTGSATPGTSTATPPAPPAEAIAACTGKATGASCSVGASVSGTCSTIGTSFACKPSGASGR